MSNIVPFRPVQRLDTHRNLITGYGTSRDHGEQFTWAEEARLAKTTLDSMYAQHPIVWKLVDLLPDDATRKWITINHDRADELNKALKRLQAREVTNEALKTARLHGGDAIYAEFKGQDPSQSLNWENPGELIALHVIEKDYISPEYLTRSLRCEYYTLTVNNMTAARVHRDRLIIVQGCNVSRDWALKNNGWHQSIVDRCKKPLLAYSISHGLVPNILKDFIRDVIKLQGLNELSLNTCEQDQTDFNDRLDAMFQAQSMLNKLVIDSEDDYVRTTTSVAGLNDLIRNPERHLVAASGMPHTKLLGESPGASLNKAGESQDKDWNKAVSAYQEKDVRAIIERMLLWVAPSLGIKEDIQFAFNPLDVPSEKEKAETLKIITDAVGSMVDRGVWSIDESRTMFESESLKTLPVLNDEAAQALAALKGDPNDDKEQSKVSSKA